MAILSFYYDILWIYKRQKGEKQNKNKTNFCIIMAVLPDAPEWKFCHLFMSANTHI